MEAHKAFATKKTPSSILAKGLGAAALLGALTLASTSVSAKEYFTIVDGALERPTGYREWVYVGTPVTPNDMNNGKAAFPEHHNVYIDPESWTHWKETGEFRDGTIIIKELVDVGSKAAVSGAGYFQGHFIGLEATIKSKKVNPNEPGNWSYYSFSTPDHSSLTETATAFPAAACNACHAAAAADDFVFTQYYPVLRAGKGTGELAIGGVSSSLK
ncbi:cytochrome P460 family protein [Enterovibrio norvegicus]|uniref:Cytochrome P460 family protein n=1 Tax=Enterovibrio norvegicus TaxID=188144 RepID=A0ABV4L444_9GAMM|nr:cytochrome P460 family protein [Enterovibrio norvegicus]OEF60205.1 cytochrome P460 [Enterovibrio norvegicus]PMI27696.1 cytochrome P460 [Enterovibrio norvegicus]TKF18836.1 cytochrome P460 [Enterovibrio norvegicus]TKF31408.1 cytochrome P460 [Enterovibrio norvegicus]